VQIRELSVPDAYEIIPVQHSDDRGTFLEWYRFDRLAEKVGHALELRQGNTSISHRGVVRGIHYADIPPSQAKYVAALSGAVLDFVIDLRVGSPAYGTWDSVVLDDVDRRAVYLAEGLGHAFVALTEGATVSYLVSEVYNPTIERGIDPLDPEIGLALPTDIGDLVLSPKDTDAPTLAQAREQGLLPNWADARAYYAALDSGQRR